MVISTALFGSKGHETTKPLDRILRSACGSVCASSSLDPVDPVNFWIDVGVLGNVDDSHVFGVTWTYMCTFIRMELSNTRSS